jgi:hypothetical protein
VDVYLEPYSVNFGIPAADAVVVATADEGGEFPTLFIYNEGEALVDDTPAPAKRIGFFLGQNAAPDADHGPIWSNLTEEALALFDAAIECGLSEGDCRVEPAGSLFRRGDADGNGALELTDAVNTLSYQFLGEFGPPCLDALDWDDNGQIEVTDPIGNLARQFAGGTPAPAPGSESCGVDPTDDDGLDCASSPSCTD